MKRISLILILLSLLTSCELLLQEATKFYSVALEPEKLSIARGQAGDLTVKVSVVVGVDLNGEASIKLYNQPDYVKAEAISIPNGLPDGIMSINVDADAPLETQKITVQIEKAGKGQRKTFELTITP
jgi:hypothetical protein